MVGPFLFLDEMGPAEFRAGTGIDVRPHPHIGLATVTYLFDGEITHRDSLGTFVAIRPGEVNWMTAGRGIVHSERTAPDRRVNGDTLHGLQCWVALPAAKEETDPSFFHRDADELPQVKDKGVTARVVAGQAFGSRSPVVTASDTIFVDVTMTGFSVSIRLAATAGSLRLAIDDVANSTTSASLAVSTTARIARIPLAPVRYSPITGRPSSRASSGASTFATRSSAPPGGNPWTSLNGCVLRSSAEGCCAPRKRGAPQSAPAANTCSTFLREGDMSASFGR